MSWYRKYRPAKIADLALDSVRERLESLLKKGSLPQVLLFAGPKGTGKTSSARIIAAILNDPSNDIQSGKSLKEPDQKAEIVQAIREGRSFVVQELDAASNRGIDEIRSLKEQLALPPQGGKVAVFILDEVHMLTTEAFNALLKMLEDTPEHVVFILATTEIHKIPPTVLSRCYTIHFQKASQKELLTVLKRIAKAEKIKIPAESLELIVAQSDGSFRDAIKSFEQIVQSSQSFEPESILQSLQVMGQQEVFSLIESIIQKDERAILDFFQTARSRAASESFLLQRIQTLLYMELEASIRDNEAKLEQKVALFLLKQFANIPAKVESSIPLLTLELLCLELVMRAKKSGGNQKAGKSVISTKVQRSKRNGEISFDNAKGDLSTSVEMTNTVEMTDAIEIKRSDNLVIPEKGDGSKLLNAWQSFVESVGSKQAAIAMLLRSSKPVAAQNGTLQIEVYYPFHKEQLEQLNYQKILEECMTPLAGGVVNLEFILQEKGVELSPVAAEANVAPTEELSQLASEALL